MNKSLERLEKEGKIKPVKSTSAEIKAIAALADRDIQLAEFVVTQNWDWAFSICYNSVLQISRAFMFSKGYRAASHEAHKNTFEFMRFSLGKECEDIVDFFDRMRQKRNRVIYDTVGLVTETEVKELLKNAKEFVALVKKKLVKYL